MLFPSVIDSTIRSTYVSCPTKFYWNYVRNLQIKGSIHLHFGKTFARGLEVFRRAFYGTGQSHDEAEILAFRSMCLEWGDRPYQELDRMKSFENCVGALLEYFTHYPPTTDTVQPLMTPTGPAVEFSFALPMDITHPDTGQPLLYAGRFDMLGKFNNSLWAVDEKSAGQLGAAWLKQWDMRGQFLGYAKAAHEHDIPVAGALIRGISILKASYGHAEVLLTIPPWKIEDWWDQIHHDTENMIRDYKSGRFSKAYAEACASFSGCSYLTLCKTPHPERWTSQYSEIKWNPVKGEEEIIREAEI